MQRVRTRLPLIFVVVSLTSLAILPFLIQRRVNRLNAEIGTIAEPARHATTQIQAALALDAAGVRGFLLTGDQQFAARHREAKAQRDAAVSRLLPLVRRLGGAEAVQANALVNDLRPADALLDSLFEGRLSRRDYLAQLGAQQGHLEGAVNATISLDDALRAAETRRLADINTTRNVAAALSVALVLLAAIAAFLVARLGAEAQQAFLDLERTTASRTRLVRGFTHDVKNPLGAADGYLALLEEGVYGTLVERQQQGVSSARRSIRAALDLIQQLLELARAEAGQLEIKRSAMDVRELARDIADAFHAQAAAAGLSLAVELSEDVPPVQSDPARVRQVLANLLSNAIKYTPRGGHIWVSACLVRDQDGVRGREWAAVQVRDDGKGIPREKQRMLFLEFTRFDPTAAEGVGLGLAISQRIARALDGEITVQSTAGHGSTFTLRLPARRSTA